MTDDICSTPEGPKKHKKPWVKPELMRETGRDSQQSKPANSVETTRSYFYSHTGHPAGAPS